MSICKTLIICFFLFSTLTSCSHNNKSDLQVYVHTVTSKKYAIQQWSKPPADYPAYSFDNNGLRDPFVPQRPTIDEVAVCQITEGHEPGLLEAVPLDSLRLVGSLQQNGERWALIRTQDGMIHNLKTNAYIGANSGRITKITDTSIEVLELIPIDTSGCTENVTILSLKK